MNLEPQKFYKVVLDSKRIEYIKVMGESGQNKEFVRVLFVGNSPGESLTSRVIGFLDPTYTSQPNRTSIEISKDEFEKILSLV